MGTSPPIRKRIIVTAPPEEAFDLFTRGMSRWWNPRYSIGAEPLAAVVLEPREGGRWYERGETGAECDWGRVLVWHPPRRVVLDWQITAAWQHDPDTHTTVDVRFTEERTGATRVELVHDGLEVLGHEAEAVRATFDGPGGWEGLLRRLAETSAAGSVAS